MDREHRAPPRRLARPHEGRRTPLTQAAPCPKPSPSSRVSLSLNSPSQFLSLYFLQGIRSPKSPWPTVGCSSSTLLPLELLAAPWNLQVQQHRHQLPDPTKKCTRPSPHAQIRASLSSSRPSSAFFCHGRRPLLPLCKQAPAYLKFVFSDLFWLGEVT